jgi:hypothetical protein
MVLTYEALAEEITPDKILDELIEAVPVPAVQLAGGTEA